VANPPPQLLLTAPPPPPRPYGLFDVALGPMPFPSANSVGGGVQYVPDTCEDGIYLYAMNCPAVSGSKTFMGVEAAISGAPFGVVASYSCGPVGFSFEEAAERVRTRMALHEQRAVEKRVWSGTTLGNDRGVIAGLFRNATDLGASACVTDAVAKLEQALADNGIVGGLIHARPYMASHLAQAHLLEKGPGRSCVTKRYTPVVFGEGYDGTGPAGEAVTATVEYMYASGRIAIWQDAEVFIPPPGQVLNKSTNELNLVGEKIFAAAVECGVWTTAVTRSCATTGVV